MSLLLALALVGALGQSTVPSPGAALSGLVVEDGSRTPIAGAQVMLLPSQPRPGRMPFRDQTRTAVTDAGGRYEFDDLEAGRYRISVQKPGFAPLHGYELPDVPLEAGERRTDVNVTLQKGAVIAGRVLDDMGEPLVDAHVMAVRKRSTPPSATSMRGWTAAPVGSGAQTNDLGEFRLFSLQPGEYYVQAMPRPDFGMTRVRRATTMLLTYFPGTTDQSAAQSINVAAGQTVDAIVVRMVGAPAFQVSGVVIDEAGRPVANAMVRLQEDEPRGSPMAMLGRGNQARTDASGRFTIDNAISGTYTLLAVAPVTLSRGAGRGEAVSVSGGSSSFTAFSATGVASGTIGGGVTTETTDGTTIQYRDDTATRVPMTINQASVVGLEVIVRRPPR